MPKKGMASPSFHASHLSSFHYSSIDSTQWKQTCTPSIFALKKLCVWDYVLCIWVCDCVRVSICLCAWACTVYIYIWRPEIDVLHLHQLLFTSFETRSLNEPEAHQLTTLVIQWAPGIDLSLSWPALVLQMCTTTPVCPKSQKTL